MEVENNGDVSQFPFDHLEIPVKIELTGFSIDKDKEIKFQMKRIISNQECLPNGLCIKSLVFRFKYDKSICLPGFRLDPNICKAFYESETKQFGQGIQLTYYPSINVVLIGYRLVLNPFLYTITPFLFIIVSNHFIFLQSYEQLDEKLNSTILLMLTLLNLIMTTKEKSPHVDGFTFAEKVNISALLLISLQLFWIALIKLGYNMDTITNLSKYISISGLCIIFSIIAYKAGKHCLFLYRTYKHKDKIGQKGEDRKFDSSPYFVTHSDDIIYEDQPGCWN